MKSCVVGIGAMGVEMALHIKNKGQDVIGIDVNLEQVESAKKRGLPSTLDLIVMYLS
jgi:UDP-N-acetyl-D-mannosaminuronate dehydrogenase